MSKSLESRLRDLARSKFRVELTHVRRSKLGFIVHSWDGTVTNVPSRKWALRLAEAIIRTAPVRFVRVVRKRESHMIL